MINRTDGLQFILFLNLKLCKIRSKFWGTKSYKVKRECVIFESYHIDFLLHMYLCEFQ